MKYDPTGLRTTMTANNKAWEESLQVRCDDRIVSVDRLERVHCGGLSGLGVEGGGGSGHRDVLATGRGHRTQSAAVFDVLGMV